MMGYWVVAAALGWLFSVWPSWTQDYASIQNAAAKVSSIQADFVQTKHLKMLARPITSTGKLWYRRPGEIRWEYTSPIKSVLISTKQGVRRVTWRNGRFQPDTDTKLKPIQTVLAQMERWLRGEFEKNNLFTTTLEAGPPARVKLVPRDKNFAKFIQVVYVVLSETPGVVDTIEIWEGPDAVTRIKLKDPKLNQPIDPRTFRPPT